MLNREIETIKKKWNILPILIIVILGTMIFFCYTDIGRESASKIQEIRNKKTQASELKSEMCIKKGISGQEVKQIQILLNKHGFKLTIDGSYGNATEKAVKTIQSKNIISSNWYCRPNNI